MQLFQQSNNMWNILPAETTDFPGLDKFNKSVSNMFLLNFYQVNFVWISPSDTETHIVCFLCYYVHDSIVFITNCFITLLQRVRGQSALSCQINVCITKISQQYVKCPGATCDKCAKHPSAASDWGYNNCQVRSSDACRTAAAPYVVEVCRKILAVLCRNNLLVYAVMGKS